MIINLALYIALQQHSIRDATDFIQCEYQEMLEELDSGDYRKGLPSTK